MTLNATQRDARCAPGSATRAARPRSTASIAWMPLRVRFSSTCSIIVRSHTTRGSASASSTSIRVPLLRACSRTSGSTASISASDLHRLARLLATAHEVVHALDHPAGPLGLLADALDRLAQQRARLGLVDVALQQVQRAGCVARDRRQRLVQFVAQQRRHLADGGEPRGGLQPLLLLARQLLDPALVADVECRAHPAGLAALRRRPAAPRRSSPRSARRPCA